MEYVELLSNLGEPTSEEWARVLRTGDKLLEGAWRKQQDGFGKLGSRRALTT